jgi:hypothetical protein
MRGRVGAYAWYQLRDFLAGRAALVALVASAFVGWRLWTLRSSIGVDWAAGLAGRGLALRLFGEMLLLLAFVGTLAGVLGIISRDRRRGHTRLLFARPVAPARYYGQAFIVRGLALAGIAALGAQLFSLFVRPVPVAGATAFIAVSWIAVGGLGFLLSALSNRDGPLLGMLLAMGVLVERYLGASPSSATGAVLAEGAQYVLPPVHVLESLRATFSRGAYPEPLALGWAIAFGAICFAAGLAALRRRPLVACLPSRHARSPSTPRRSTAR